MSSSRFIACLVALTAVFPGPALAQTAPTISSIFAKSTLEGTAPPAIAFTIGDAETAAADLFVTAISSDETLVPAAGIALGGTDANRTITLTPPPELSGTTEITLTVKDEDSQTASSTFLLTVHPLYSLPAETIPELVMDADTTFTINFQMSDGSWVPSVTRTNTTLFRSVGTGSTSDLRLQGTGTNRTLRLRPAPGKYGESFISITITGDPEGPTTSTFKVTVRPVTLPDNLLAIPDRSSTLDVLRNDTQPTDGSSFTLQSVTQPAHGELVITNNGATLRYTPEVGYLGEDEFIYIVHDSLTGYTFKGTGYITVADRMNTDLVHMDFRANIVNGEWIMETHSYLRFGPLNAAGTGPIHGGANNNTILDYDETVVYANPSSYTQLSESLDPDYYSFLGAAPGESLWILPQTSQSGMVWPGINTAGMVSGAVASYTPTGDPRATANAAWIRFEMVAARMPDDAVFSMYNSSHVFWDSIDGINGPDEANIGGNVSDTFWKTSGSHAHMNWTFTKPGRYEIDFQAKAFVNQDGNLVEGVSPVTTMIFDVDSLDSTPPTESAPTLKDDIANAIQGGLAIVIDALANDSSSPDRWEELHISALSEFPHGAASIAPDGKSITYLPAADFSGIDTFSYTVTDEHGGSATADVAVTVESVNTAPVFAGYSFQTLMNQTTSISLAELLAETTDADGDTVTLTTISPTSTAGGSVSLDATHVTYVPPLNGTGDDTFEVTFSDGNDGETTGALLVTIVADPESGSDLRTIQILANGQVQVSFAGVPGQNYQVERSTDLSEWAPVGAAAVADDNGNIAFIESAAPEGRAFYRTRVAP